VKVKAKTRLFFS